MNGLIFDEKTLLNGNIFQFEERLHSRLNKYVENGAVLCTYFSRDGSESTVDRGTLSIDQLFGENSPLRFSMILDFPIYGLHSTNPEDDEEVGVHDIRVDGDVLIIPGTVIPKQYDCFIINHLKMNAIFEITNVTYDSMKQDGFYKVHYRLHSTSKSTIDALKKQSIRTMHTDLNAVGSDVNPIITEDDYTKKIRINQMLNQMITMYRSMYYNERHNCFLFYDRSNGQTYFDMCANHFIGKYSLMNAPGNGNVLILLDKLQDSQFSQYYANSIYTWIELHCPKKLLQKFPYITSYADGYPYSSFVMWGEGNIEIIQPIRPEQDGTNFHTKYYLDDTQLNGFLDDEFPPRSNEFELLLWKYMHRPDTLSLKDISLDTGDPLIKFAKYSWETFIFTPIIIHIIRQILRTS